MDKKNISILIILLVFTVTVGCKSSNDNIQENVHFVNFYEFPENHARLKCTNSELYIHYGKDDYYGELLYKINGKPIKCLTTPRGILYESQFSNSNISCGLINLIEPGDKKSK